MKLKDNQAVSLGFFAAIAFPMLIIWFAQNYTKDVQTGAIAILLLAVIAGLTLPNILLSWLLLVLTTIAAAVLLLGYVVIAQGAKLILLVSFPIEAVLVFYLQQYIINWHSIGNNKDSINRYVNRFDSNVKLLTTYTARKVYNKIAQNVKSRPDLDLWVHASLIQWTNHEQYAQGNRFEHDQILRQLAKILKQTRLSAEGIYYLGNAEFLILSPEIQDKTISEIDAETDAELSKLKREIPGGIKWAKVRVDQSNIAKLSDDKELEKHWHRILRIHNCLS